MHAMKISTRNSELVRLEKHKDFLESLAMKVAAQMESLKKNMFVEDDIEEIFFDCVERLKKSMKSGKYNAKIYKNFCIKKLDLMRKEIREFDTEEKVTYRDSIMNGGEKVKAVETSENESKTTEGGKAEETSENEEEIVKCLASLAYCA